MFLQKTDAISMSALSTMVNPYLRITHTGALNYRGLGMSNIDPDLILKPSSFFSAIPSFKCIILSGIFSKFFLLLTGV